MAITRTSSSARVFVAPSATAPCRVRTAVGCSEMPAADRSVAASTSIRPMSGGSRDARMRARSWHQPPVTRSSMSAPATIQPHCCRLAGPAGTLLHAARRLSAVRVRRHQDDCRRIGKDCTLFEVQRGHKYFSPFHCRPPVATLRVAPPSSSRRQRWQGRRCRRPSSPGCVAEIP
jgi:hypothetical protein